MLRPLSELKHVKASSLTVETCPGGTTSWAGWHADCGGRGGPSVLFFPPELTGAGSSPWRPWNKMVRGGLRPRPKSSARRVGSKRSLPPCQRDTPEYTGAHRGSSSGLWLVWCLIELSYVELLSREFQQKVLSACTVYSFPPSI